MSDVMSDVKTLMTVMIAPHNTSHPSRAYMNPFCKFSSDGHSFTCNICGATNDVPYFYYSTVDAQGRRFDALERPELSHGTYEWKVGADFCTRPPQQPIFAFVVDMTKNARVNGVFDAVLSSIRACVEVLKENPRAKVGVCVFDTVTHMILMRVREKEKNHV